MTENAQGLTDIGRLICLFARVDRVTFHEDGQTPESDTDHTMMTAVSACALSHKLYPDTLDHGLVAQFAIVHDLVEAYAGDTDTFGFAEEQKAEKNAREHEAFVRIKAEFENVFPWLPEMIGRYEQLDTREAKFVKTVDKLMTKVTHILNSGAYFKGRGLNKEQMWHDYLQCRPTEVRYADEFPELIVLIDEMILEARIRTYGS